MHQASRNLPACAGSSQHPSREWQPWHPEARGLVLAKLVDAAKIDGDATRRHLTTGPISDLRKAYREGGVRFGGCDRRRERSGASTRDDDIAVNYGSSVASRSRRRAGQGATCEHQQQGEDEPPHGACVNTCAGPRKAGASTGTYTVVST